MVFQSSEIQHRKRIKVGDDNVANHGDDLDAAGMNAVVDMTLFKFSSYMHVVMISGKKPLKTYCWRYLSVSPIIDYRSAKCTATVCHKWHSVISKNPHFIPRFKSHHHQHQHRYPLPYTIFFRKADDKYHGIWPQYFQPICKLFSDEESKFCTTTNFLDFIMPSSPMVIRGSCNDLLLVSPGSCGSTLLYVCNPFTKQFIRLPQIPRPNNYTNFDYHVVGHALVCMPGPSSKFRFKVVEFQNTIYPDPGSDNMVQPIMLYCSESRKWETRRFHYPRPTIQYEINWLHGVACNGILYWLEFKRYGANRRVIYLDLSNDQCGAIDFPDDCCHATCFPRDQIGVVRERGGEELRLLQVVLTKRMESTVDLKVWRLSDKKEWVLVHHKNKLKKPNRKSYQALPFVHPTDGDLVFMAWSQKVFQYNLIDTNAKTYELIGKLDQPMAILRVVDEAPFDQLLQFPVVHSNWPTQICLT